MRHGLLFPGGGMSLRELMTIGAEAEAAGIDSLYVTEAWRSGFVPLAALATVTSRVRLGPYILNAYGRSPLLAGMSAIDLDELTGGRLLLGVGTGNRHINEDWQGIPHTATVTKMTEYVTLLRQIVRARLGSTVSFAGELHRMHWSPAVQPCRESIPVYLSATFPKMVEVAGRVADGLAIGAIVSPEYIRDVIRPRAQAAAASAGRDPAGLGFLAGAMVSVSDDREQARQAAREAICRLFSPLPHPYYDFLLREQGFSQAADAAARYMPEGKLQHAAAAMTDDVIDSVAIAGTADECRARLACYDGAVDELLCANVADQTVAGFDQIVSHRGVLALAGAVPRSPVDAPR